VPCPVQFHHHCAFVKLFVESRLQLFEYSIAAPIILPLNSS
jgi:hypothetical protein